MRIVLHQNGFMDTFWNGNAHIYILLRSRGLPARVIAYVRASTMTLWPDDINNDNHIERNQQRPWWFQLTSKKKFILFYLIWRSAKKSKCSEIQFGPKWGNFQCTISSKGQQRFNYAFWSLDFLELCRTNIGESWILSQCSGTMPFYLFVRFCEKKGHKRNKRKRTQFQGENPTVIEMRTMQVIKCLLEWKSICYRLWEKNHSKK